MNQIVNYCKKMEGGVKIFANFEMLNSHFGQIMSSAV